MTSAQFLKRDRFLTALRQSPVVMGILNVTPDSFSDGGLHEAVDTAVTRAKIMEAQGAAIIDVGGESTRPGAVPIGPAEELTRVTPVLRAICATLNIAVSIDTYKSAVARHAAGLGAAVINDVGGLQRDPGMATAVADTGSAVVIMHARETTDGGLDIMEDIRRFFDRSLRIAHEAGIPEAHIILDPGIGFGKTLAQNYACLAHLRRLEAFGLPILLGLSRKRMIGHVVDAEVDSRLVGTLAANVLGLANGANILRVHDVSEHVVAIRIFNAMGAAK